MTVACLILGYRAGGVLARSLHVLHAAGFDVFIHLDRKADQGLYLRSLGDQGGKCTFVVDPYDVFWGGYTMVLAELKLLSTAHARGPYDKYVLLSDDTFPAVPPSVLRERLDDDSDQATLVMQPNHSPFYVRYYNYYCLDHPTTAAKNSSAGNRSGAVDEVLEAKVAEIAELRRRGKKPLDVYFGSQFWALSNDSVDLVLRIVAEDDHLRKSFEYSALPDETMIQSILGNFKFRKNQTTGPVYADFAFTQGGAPRVIANQKDLPLDLQPTHLFLRKMAPNADEFLDSMLSRLEKGFCIDGHQPSSNGQRNWIAVTGIDEVTIRLGAPLENPGSSWHGLESFGGRSYRWTASEEVEWYFEETSIPPGQVRFVLTLVIGSGLDFLSQCTLTFGDHTRNLQYTDGVLSAAFQSESAVSPVRVILKTPRITSPRESDGREDDRKLGLSVAT